jgi:hypothetical protein
MFKYEELGTHDIPSQKESQSSSSWKLKLGARKMVLGNRPETISSVIYCIFKCERFAAQRPYYDVRPLRRQFHFTFVLLEFGKFSLPLPHSLIHSGLELVTWTPGAELFHLPTTLVPPRIDHSPSQLPASSNVPRSQGTAVLMCSSPGRGQVRFFWWSYRVHCLPKATSEVERQDLGV